jgi:hypothetical protein
MRSRSHCCRRKAIIITYSECVSVALIIQHANRMCRIILLYFALSGSTVFFPSHKRYDFMEKVIEHKICVFNLSVNFVQNVSRSEKI